MAADGIIKVAPIPDPRRVSLSFHDIEYSVLVKKEQKPLLRGVSGIANSGEMLCVLGPSGAGKTSLIHILVKKISSSSAKTIKGQVLCNGESISATKYQRISGYVTQEDVFNAALTVEETLRFTAKLRLPSSARAERVREIASQLQLDGCLKTYIGDDSNPYLKGISGGEKRRLAIAMEILDPNISVLVLDEPTSGLDAAAALMVTNLLRALADSGLTVVATLHQPRHLIMSRFDQLMILAAGRRVFYGDLPRYVPYLESCLQAEIPQHESPYDLFLDVLNPLIGREGGATLRAVPAKCEFLADHLADLYDGSDLRKEADDAGRLKSHATDQAIFKSDKAGVGWLGKFSTILHRTFLVKMRDPMVLATQVSSAIMMGLIFGVLYFGTYDKQVEFAILDTQMVCTMTVMMCTWLPYDVTLTFPRERQIFLRERKAGLYPTSAFYFARITADMPMHILAACIMAVMVYLMAGLRQGLHLFLVVCVVSILEGAAVMQTIGAVCRTFEEANILMMLVMMMTMMMSTTFVREVPSWLEWMREISLMGLLADIAMYFEFRDIDPAFGTPEDVFHQYGVRITDGADLMKTFVVLVGLYIVPRVLTFLAVKFLHTGRTCKEDLWD